MKYVAATAVVALQRCLPVDPRVYAERGVSFFKVCACLRLPVDRMPRMPRPSHRKTKTEPAPNPGTMGNVFVNIFIRYFYPRKMRFSFPTSLENWS